MKVHSDNSYIDVDGTKSLDEGLGKFFASLGKEIDEHDAVGKMADAKSFMMKSFSFMPFLIVIMMIIIVCAAIFIFLYVGGSVNVNIK